MIMPAKDEVMEYQVHKGQVWAPIMVASDFECILPPSAEDLV